MAGTIFSCTNTTATTETGLDPALGSVANARKVEDIPIPPPAEEEGTNYRLTYQDVTRILTVWNPSSKNLKFRIQVMDAEGDCDLDLTGVAKLLEEGSESRTLPDGEEVFANQFNFEMENCGISILLQMEAQYAWVEQWDCPAHEGKCSYGTEFALTKVD